MADCSFAQRISSSYLSGNSAAYVEALFEAYLDNPNSIDETWRVCFDQLPKTADGQHDMSHEAIQAYFIDRVRQPTLFAGDTDNQAGTVDALTSSKQAAVSKFIDAYRAHGHLQANTDPLQLAQLPEEPSLTLPFHGLQQADLDTVFLTHGFDYLGKTATLRDIHQTLQHTYCGHIGFEYQYIDKAHEVAWLQQRIEANCAKPQFSDPTRQRILSRLCMAEGLEKYLGRRYVGQKRFSLEGADSLIPALDDFIQTAGEMGVKECVFGMAHRGRLNVLTNILGKPPRALCDEFSGNAIPEDMSGDVKYHMGFSSDVQTSGGMLHLALAFNPSHLEIINPVVEGSVRARQHRRADLKGNQVVPLLIHGDAAFAGQGVVMETLNLSQTRGFSTGGTLHVIVNNQVGFTTSNPEDARSTLYASDVAKMLQTPIFHVNGDDPEAVVWAMRLALEYRMHFNRDVVIDLVCYRRHGHNEADEPSGTQPLMYAKIKTHPTPFKCYGDALIQANLIDKAALKTLEETYRQQLDAGECTIAEVKAVQPSQYTANWKPYIGTSWDTPANTGVAQSTLTNLAKQLLDLPTEFVLQKQVATEMKNRAEMAAGDLPLNWGFAETMAYATLLHEGYSVRLTGQDSGRGTFAHRHAQLHNAKTGQVYIPLQHVNKTADITLTDSLLSEEAVLGFEYGYAGTVPESLVLWEAQFGDFVNGAQVVIDQFISSGWQKWGRLCGLTLLLPHGYEGMGPEHSSARPERFLQLCAEHNMQVCVPSTPAQVFHMLRRQMVRPCRVPLIVMTPKSLLRHKLAVSSLVDLSDGRFQEIIPEIDPIDVAKVKRLVLCSGKVYYDLLTKRRELKRDDVAILRIEQLYPFPEAALSRALSVYKQAKEVVWCQEEPQNQGAWYCTRHRFQACIGDKQRLSYAGRPMSASPAVGYLSLHLQQQAKLVEDALG